MAGECGLAVPRSALRDFNGFVMLPLLNTQRVLYTRRIFTTEKVAHYVTEFFLYLNFNRESIVSRWFQVNAHCRGASLVALTSRRANTA